MDGNYLGIEIGGTKIQLLVVDTRYTVLERVMFFVGDTKEASLIQKALRNNLSNLLLKHDIMAIGVGFGGPIDYRTGTIYRSFHVQGWNGFNLKDWLTTLTDIPVFVDNDGNIAALGEAVLGAGMGSKRVFYITLGSGAGGGFIVDGEIYHGKEPGEFEVGHLRLSKSGSTMESSVSGWALNKKLNAYIEKKPGSPLALLTKESKTDASKNLMLAIDKEDVGAKSILNATIDDLAWGLSHVVHIVNPEIIILGGGLSNLGEYLPTMLSEKLPNYLMDTLKGQLPMVKLSQLKEDAVPLGAAVYAAQQMK
ncbi:ROK family protein [Pricia sp.]|uniref:ROK family protein n=1 Tax=Pricia sp. TaxID=2268138 RepID=UPI00359361A8